MGSAKQARQFVAVLHKNFILQTRSGRAWFGLGGWAALAAQILVPVTFFTLMWIPKYYIRPFPHPEILTATDYELDSKWWAGSNAYTGPAVARGMKAVVALAPSNPSTQAAAEVLARALACPDLPTKRVCSSRTIVNFYCLFLVDDVPETCHDPSICNSSPECWQPVLQERLLLMPSEADVLRYSELQPGMLDAAIIFDGPPASSASDEDASKHQGQPQPPQQQEQAPPLLQYRIRMNHSDVPPPQLTYDLFDVSPGNTPVPGNGLWLYQLYWFFANLQHSLDRALIGLALSAGQQQHQQQGGPLPAAIYARVKPFPWPATLEDLGAASAAAFFNLLLVYAFLAPTRSAVATIVREKELRLREGMRILGLTEPAYWAAWATTHWAALAASGLLCALVASYPFQHTSVVLMVAFFWLFAAALVMFSYWLSTLFSSSRVAGTATQLLYALAMLPGFLLPLINPYGGPSWYAACLLPPSAASLLAACLVNWERVAAGVNWATWALPVAQQGSFCVRSVFGMLLLDVALYAVLTWYCDKVLPSSHGQRLPAWFPLQASYWRSDGPSKAPEPADPGRLGGAAADGGQRQQQQQQQQQQGGDAGEEDVVVRARQLFKEFPAVGGGTKVAVAGVDLDMRRGRITALLGHNGAGKTTTINLLTGMLQPSSGDALINGRSILTDIGAIRRDLGVCPQFDILWPDITVREHLQLYAAIKGMGRAEAQAAAEVAAAEVALSEKLDVRAGELSGGQRRKLSVAIAFLAAPSVVFLDEPTSGMDPYSRRFTWEVRRRARSSAVVLTTHSMEEADTLADDIAIMAQGVVAAKGTPLELKSRYGAGYTLSLVLEPGADVAPLTALVTSHVSGAELLSAAAAEAAYRLPREQAGRFAALLRQLDSGAQVLGVASYGLSVTTLEEVFLRITEQFTPERLQLDGAGAAGMPTGSPSPGPGPGLLPMPAAPTQQHQGASPGPPRPLPAAAPPARCLTGLPLHLQQLRALLAKRCLSARRDRLALVTQLLVPLLLVYLALWAGNVSVKPSRAPALQLGRGACLGGQPALLAASEAARASPLLPLLLQAFPRDNIQDTGRRELWRGISGPPLNATLDAHLLQRWFKGARAYDALFLPALPDAADVAAGRAPLTYTLMFNQSAIAGIPAALSQANSAFLRLLLLARQADISSSSGGSAGSGNSSFASAAAAASATGKAPAWHAVPTAAGLPARLRNPADAHAPAATAAARQPEPSLRASSDPLPVLASEPEVALRQDAGGLLLVLCLTMATSVLSASFVVFLVREQDNNSKHVQIVSGASPAAFWAAHLLWDLLVFSLPAAGMLLLFWSQHLPQFQGERLAALAAVLWAFGLASLPLTYLLSLPFSDEMKALQRLNTLFFLVGYLGFLATWVMDLIQMLLRPPRVAAVNGWLKAGLRLVSPHYCFARGVYDVERSYGGGLFAGLGRGALQQGLALAGAGAGGSRAAAAAEWGAGGAAGGSGSGVATAMLGRGGTAGGGSSAGLGPWALGASSQSPWSADVAGTALLHLALQSAFYGGLVLLIEAGLFASAATSAKVAARRMLAWAAGGGQSEAAAEDGDSLRQPLLQQGTGAAAAGGGAAARAQQQQQQQHLLLLGLAESGSGEDEDVARERLAVQQHQRDHCQVLLDGVAKSYSQGWLQPPVRAVRGLWLGVEGGECFGLLGTNGAGKTTTFKVLTGQVAPDKGDAQVAGHSVVQRRGAARRLLGYCPQFEALPGALTPVEVLHMYARLRGVPEAHVPETAAGLLKRLGLVPHAGQRCDQLSGGNKRKLSVAVALAGAPPVVLLDEPSTGMDPAARRALWSTLQREVLGAGHTVVMTSHSMEECEALCSRIAIMVGGSLRCLGSVQHLKGRFGEGYRLEMKLAAHEEQEGAVGPGAGDGEGCLGCAAASTSSLAPASCSSGEVLVAGTAASEAGSASGSWVSGDEGEAARGKAARKQRGVAQSVSVPPQPGSSVHAAAAAAAGATCMSPLSPAPSLTPQSSAFSSSSKVPQAHVQVHRRHHRHHRHQPGAPHEVHLRMFCRTDAALAFVSEACPAAQLLEREPCRLVFSLPRSGLDLPGLFELLEANRQALGLVDYSISQTTLEQVFVALARGSQSATY